MRARKAKLARGYAKGYEDRLDTAFASQRPTWLRVLAVLLPMHDVDRIFKGPLERWCAKMAPKNEAFKRAGMKTLAKTAAHCMRLGVDR